MATRKKTTASKTPAKPVEIKISDENAAHLHTLNAELMKMREKPEVLEYIAAIESRNNFISHVARMCNITSGMVIDMEQMKFVLPTNGN